MRDGRTDLFVLVKNARTREGRESAVAAMPPARDANADEPCERDF